MIQNKSLTDSDRLSQQAGVSLLLAILVLAAITAIAFSLAAIVSVEIRVSGDVLRTEPALYTVQGITEETFYKYKRNVSDASLDIIGCKPASLNICFDQTVAGVVKMDQVIGVTRSYDETPTLATIKARPHNYLLIDPNKPQDFSHVYDSFKVAVLRNGSRNSLTVQVWRCCTNGVEVLAQTSAKLYGGDVFPYTISSGDTGQYRFVLTNNRDIDSTNILVQLDAVKAAATNGKKNLLPLVGKQVLDITAVYLGLTRKYTLDIPQGGSQGPGNLALGKPASSSSALSPASLAVDGNTNGNFYSNSVFHSSANNQEWWQVDLGSVRTIQTINVWNRTDCCGTRLNNAHVYVSDTPFPSSNVGDYPIGTAQVINTFNVNRTGRYVRIQLPNEYLQLAEVEVIGY